MILSQLQLALQAYQRGESERAAMICQGVLDNQPDQPDALNILGNIARDQGKFELALRFFEYGLQASPNHVHLLNGAGLVHRKLGNPEEARQCFEQTLQIDADYYQGRYNLANLCRAEGDGEQAEALYRQVLVQQSGFVDAIANLSSLLEETHRLEEAEALARQAVELQPNNIIARLTLANLARRGKRYDAVLENLAPLLKGGRLSPVNFAVAAGLMAWAREGLGEYPAAFDLYLRANDALFELHASSMNGLRSMYAPESLQALLEFFDGRKPAAQSEAPSDDKALVFLVGFPRSGTTLLDQILSSHSRVTVLEEKENLEAFYNRFPAKADSLSELVTCPEAELSQWRDRYWQQIESEVELGDDSVLVDKLPLNTILLPHIRKLFPSAKIVFALRDPRDAVFSCFQQRFGMNQAMFQFLKLDTAVSYYDRVMSLAKVYVDQLSIPVHFIRYESVIADFDGQVGDVLDYLGLPWEDGVRDYRSVARQRRISTPSARDVTRPLYTSSIGKWRYYREFVGDRFGPLQQWVEHWGYEAE